MKLIDATLCITCEEIYPRNSERPNQRCPSCGSEAMPLALARIIEPMSRDSALPFMSITDREPVAVEGA